jgi:Rhodopirellula transposase DDE domain
LVSHEVVVELIAATTTRTGLTVHAELDRGAYPLGIKVSDQQLAAVPLAPHDFHGEWNYTITPRAGAGHRTAGIFLEFAAEEVLRLEAAVQQQEDMAFQLRQLTAAQLTEFICLLNQVAGDWPYDTGRAYPRSLPEFLGIA